MSNTTPLRDSAGLESKIFSPITLPCGRVLQNRLVKVAMYEHLAALYGGPPNRYHYSLYSKWSKHNWGMVITGNIQVSDRHLTLGRDIYQCTRARDRTPPVATARPSFRNLAIMQLSHAGRQSVNIMGGRPPFEPALAPSAIPVGSPGKSKNSNFLSDLFHRFAFQTPHAMSLADIDEVVAAFVRGATLAVQSGFDGIQLHGAHGSNGTLGLHLDLLAQFISPKTNVRTDEYSCHPHNALRLLHRIVLSIRSTVPKGFIVGIKINAGDYVDSDVDRDKSFTEISGNAKDEQEERALDHVRTIANWGGVDFIEISGGDYENPEFMASTNSTSKSSRQAFFARFSHRAMKALAIPSPNSAHASSSLPLILLTGGFRTHAQLRTALSSQHAHLLGIGRGSVLCPELPELLLEREQKQNYTLTESHLPFRSEPVLDMSSTFLGRWPWSWFWNWVPKVRIIGAGIGMAWYVVMIRRIAMAHSLIRRKDGDDETGMKVDYTLGGIGAVVRMWIWVDVTGLFEMFSVWVVFSVLLAVAVFGISTFYRLLL